MYRVRALLLDKIVLDLAAERSVALGFTSGPPPPWLLVGRRKRSVGVSDGFGWGADFRARPSQSLFFRQVGPRWTERRPGAAENCLMVSTLLWFQQYLYCQCNDYLPPSTQIARCPSRAEVRTCHVFSRIQSLTHHRCLSSFPARLPSVVTPAPSSSCVLGFGVCSAQQPLFNPLEMVRETTAIARAQQRRGCSARQVRNASSSGEAHAG